ncbi:MAG: DUF882 domain-containing protein [Desulfobacteraceae bacterium]|nr:DUF882 domain-containing protein [Desulfobacteraceae bacterium]MBU4002314.1 DUF882 domain-containing protein [Pseudomonadota bacterium]MBU4053894.1 DUF882 domain-containing protein [Pseudomonadota bacterium]
MAPALWNPKRSSHNQNRRHFLKTSLLALAGTVLPTSVWAYAGKTPSVRSLSFFHEHTREKLTVNYYKYGVYSRKALKKINYILRDHRSGDIHHMDTDLLDLLYVISRDLDTPGPFHIISGYRSPSTNSLLRKKSTGVAKSSYHMVGKAIDVSLPSIRLDKLRKTAVRLEAGGVGYYPQSEFVHVDIGPVRHW